VGSGINYSDNWDSLSNGRQHYFNRMCQHNHQYFDSLSTADATANSDGIYPGCEQPFVDYRASALADAQTAFFMTVVWSQISNVLIRKTQVASILTKERMLANMPMMYSICFEICLVVAICYIPGLNSVFYLTTPNSTYCSCALWIMPLLIIWDETRKYFCRRDRHGWMNRFTNF